MSNTSLFDTVRAGVRDWREYLIRESQRGPVGTMFVNPVDLGNVLDARDVHGDCTDFENTLLGASPDAWDFDEAQCSIVEKWVEHLVSEVKRLGGCLKPWCAWDDREPCDHGYLRGPVGFHIEGDRRVGRLSDLPPESGDRGDTP